MAPTTLVFDLDETLIHTAQQPLGDVRSHMIVVDGECMYVHLRPGAVSLMRCISQASPHVSMGIWTAARANYARKVLDILMPEWRRKLSFLKTRADCVNVGSQQRPRYVKDMTRLGLPRSHVAIFDDNPDTIRYNQTAGFHAVQMRPFLGRAEDTSLIRLGRKFRKQLRHNTLRASNF